ncbi:MAG: hypothetical protein ACI9SE_004166, partial [Neolewinella sp.]
GVDGVDDAVTLVARGEAFGASVLSYRAYSRDRMCAE